MIKLFLDTEFTGLCQHTTLISLALVAETGEEFYAELTDYDRRQLNPWIEANVMSQLLPNEAHIQANDFKRYRLKGTKEQVKNAIEQWISRFGSDRNLLQVWADCLAWDWVLFCELFGGGLNLPPQIHYIPMELAVLFYVNEGDADLDRLTYIGKDFNDGSGGRHNALFDARLELACYKKLSTT